MGIIEQSIGLPEPPPPEPLGEQADAIIVDFHTEATSEIQAMGHFLDGKVSLVVGTHTHIPTADQRILRGGTALMADAGMCGVFDSVIGTEDDEPLNRFLTKIPRARFEPAMGPATISGLAVEIDESVDTVYADLAGSADERDRPSRGEVVGRDVPRLGPVEERVGLDRPVRERVLVGRPERRARRIPGEPAEAGGAQADLGAGTERHSG